MIIPTSARTANGELGYLYAKSVGHLLPLDCEPRLISWRYWYLIENRFPYDMIFSQHDMLVPVSGVATRAELTVPELIELNGILDELSNQYDLWFENFNHRRSIKATYHLHLGRYHGRREDFKL